MVRLKLFDYINAVFLIVVCCSIIVPFLFVISQSLMSNEDIMRNGVTFFPRHVVFDSYKYLLTGSSRVYQAFGNSFFITFFGTLFSLLFTGSIAYALSKKYLPYRNVVTAVLLASMFFGGGLIPSYLLITALGLKNSLWAVMIPSFLNVWYAFLLRNFFMEIPPEVEESAHIDGANDVTIFARIALPMSMPAIATIGLFYAVGYWNSWFSASIYLSEQSKWPLQLLLKSMLLAFDPNMSGVAESLGLLAALSKDSVRAAMIMITTVPILLVYPFLQRYFVKGMIVGSVKG
ncbi:carbohydrate ABC transporter permease [Paenibacillus contaminans]|uniref:Carbohydrate ABC transporter permease n=1 Tax=Paenibacillus contaminans TaxID=450362 RepID=A0A329MAR3_9BACL|nr:carbohydrate ABC transporter permease [Paenibacillus contaminans]RAV16728.1 carbohydrate ABC transporter permease [Paenibacillus contaminans]